MLGKTGGRDSGPAFACVQPLSYRWHGPCFADCVLKGLSVGISLSLVWLVIVGTGFTLLARYQNASGSIGRTPSDWPHQTRVELDQKLNTLVMFVHPQCPCTRASMEELNRLLARCHGNVAAQVWFFKPAGFSADWTRSDLWRSAAAIPGVTVHEDPDGAQARLFGAETSGFVLLYDPHGKLRFKGGITGSRGHAGDNAGEDSVVSLLDGHGVSLTQTPVYGCSLLGECRATAQTTAQ
jgi:hypothetical protein